MEKMEIDSFYYRISLNGQLGKFLQFDNRLGTSDSAHYPKFSCRVWTAIAASFEYEFLLFQQHQRHIDKFN